MKLEGIKIKKNLLGFEIYGKSAFDFFRVKYQHDAGGLYRVKI